MLHADYSAAQRRNKWICALKIAMAKAKVFGPEGDPDAKPSPKPITMVPWEHVSKQEEQQSQAHHHASSQQSISQTYSFTDQNAVIRKSLLPQCHSVSDVDVALCCSRRLARRIRRT